MELKSVLMEELTWQEIREAMDNGYRTALLFVGAIEQHGPHLAEATDAILGYYQGIDLAKRLGNVLVGPVVRPGLSAHHVVLPGTVTLRPETFRMLIEDHVTSYLSQGFETIILCFSHGGNYAVLSEVTEELQARYPDKKIICPIQVGVLFDQLAVWDEEFGVPVGTFGGHSCRWETDLMLALCPQYVRMEKAQESIVGVVDAAKREELFTKGILAISEIGVMGDPTGSTAEEGRYLFEKQMDLYEKIVRETLAQ